MLLERAFQILRSLFEASLGYSVGRFLTIVDFLRAVDLYREVSEISLGNVVEEVPEVVPLTSILPVIQPRIFTKKFSRNISRPHPIYP
jgi:hypothetical protein